MSRFVGYDETSPSSIENYAKGLLNKSLHDFMDDDQKQIYKGKGRLGQLLEDVFFHYKPNSKAEADFPKAGVELKSTPLRKIKKGLVAKERLVMNMIDYFEEHKHIFRNSSFWKKNSLLLLMFYLYEKEEADIDHIFKIIRLWEFPATDLKIIKDDWQKIVGKIRAGKAHELSEGDTLYLGACTKGATREKSMRDQPFSKKKAPARAFSIKQRYLNFIIEKSLKNEPVEIDPDEINKILFDDYGVVSDRRPKYGYIDLNEIEPAVKSINEYIEGETFEQNIIRRFSKYYGYSESQLLSEFGLDETNAKNKFYALSRRILGVEKKKIEEFEKADVEMKTIRLEKTGNLKESMSFAQIKFKEIINEDWEDSYLWNTLTRKFFFVVFQRDENDELRLKKVLFWNMPNKDLEIAKMFWKDTKEKIKKNDHNNFIKIADDKIFHVRPKAINSKDLMETPFGTFEKKKAYWLNRGYVKSIIDNG